MNKNSSHNHSVRNDIFIIIGADGYNVPDFICDIYFNNGGKQGAQKPCFGGVLALDGKTGKILWTRWADHKVFAVTCQADLNSDNTIDCVVGGMSGVRINNDIILY